MKDGIIVKYIPFSDTSNGHQVLKKKNPALFTPQITSRAQRMIGKGITKRNKTPATTWTRIKKMLGVA